MGNNHNSGVLKFFGVLMILFGLIYAILGTVALMGKIDGVLPGHDAQEILIVILAYAVSVLAIICGIVCVGLLIAAIGLVSLIWLQVTQDTFSISDCIALVMGAAIFYLAGKKN